MVESERHNDPTTPATLQTNELSEKCKETIIEATDNGKVQQLRQVT